MMRSLIHVLAVFVFTTTWTTSGHGALGFVFPSVGGRVIISKQQQHVSTTEILAAAATSEHAGVTVEEGQSTANVLERIFMKQPKGASREQFQLLVRECNLRKNFVVVITGATGGIGSALCQAVLQLGGLVVAVDIHQQALEEFQQQQDDPDRIRIVTADFSDLESVANAANSILNQVSQIDILVNNAGLAYKLEDGEKAGVSKQGYDLCFQVNYLSHVLLTEKLLPKLITKSSSGRVVHVTSGLSFGVDGSGLVPQEEAKGGGIIKPPSASQPGAKGLVPRHNSMAYGNSKLAQIWHSASLNRNRGHQQGHNNNTILSLCACPSWAATGIAGDENESGAQVLQKFAFPTRPSNTETEVAGPGLKSILFAMFLPKEKLGSELLTGAKFMGNSQVFEIICPRRPKQPNHFCFSNFMNQFVVERIDMARILAFCLILPFQRWTHPEDDVFFQTASFESENAEFQDTLYSWSEQAISPWLATTQPEKGAQQRRYDENKGDEDLLLLV